jgi:hypothetical protein
MMIIKRWWKGVAILFGLLLCLPVAQAAQPLDFTRCNFSTHTILATTEELTVTSADTKGIVMSNLANKGFDNMTVH